MGSSQSDSWCFKDLNLNTTVQSVGSCSLGSRVNQLRQEIIPRIIFHSITPLFTTTKEGWPLTSADQLGNFYSVTSNIRWHLRPGTHPTNSISIEFEIQPKFAVLWFKMCSTDHNKIWYSCHMCKIPFWWYCMNKSIGWLLSFIRISIVGWGPAQTILWILSSSYE